MFETIRRKKEPFVQKKGQLTPRYTHLIYTKLILRKAKQNYQWPTTHIYFKTFSAATMHTY